MEIFVTGYGAISCIGLNAQEHLESLITEKSGIRKGLHPHSERFLVKFRYQMKHSFKNFN